MRQKVWTRLQALCLAVILLATNVVVPVSAADASGASAGTTTRPKLYIDFLSDDSRRTGIATDPVGAVAPADPDDWRYSDPVDHPGTIFWVGVGVEDIDDLALAKNGLFSAELGFYYNAKYVRPYTDPNSGADLDAGFRAALEAVNLADATTTTLDESYQWDSNEYEITEALPQVDLSDPEVLKTVYEYSTQERGPKDEGVFDAEVYDPLKSDWEQPQMLYISLEKKAGANGAHRFSTNSDEGRQYLMMIPFELLTVDTRPTPELCFILARNASVLTLGGAPDGVTAYAAWERETISHPDENLKLQLEFTGDLNIFTGEKEEDTLYEAELVVTGTDAALYNNNAILSIYQDPSGYDINWKTDVAPASSAIYPNLGADTTMHLHVECENTFTATVRVFRTDDPTTPIMGPTTLTGGSHDLTFVMPTWHVRVEVLFQSSGSVVEYTATLDARHDPSDSYSPTVNTATMTNITSGVVASIIPPALLPTVTGGAGDRIQVALALHEDYNAIVTTTDSAGTVTTLSPYTSTSTSAEYWFSLNSNTTVKVEFVKATFYDAQLRVETYEDNGSLTTNTAVIAGNTAEMNNGGAISTNLVTQDHTVHIASFRRSGRTVYLNTTCYAGYQVRDVQVYKADGTTLLGSLTPPSAGGTAMVQTTTPNQAYYFTMPAEEIDVLVVFEPATKYTVELDTNLDRSNPAATNYFNGSTVEVTSDSSLHQVPGAVYLLDADTEQFKVLEDDNVYVEVDLATGTYVTVTVKEINRTTGQVIQNLYVISNTTTNPQTYEFAVPALTTSTDHYVEVSVQFNSVPAPEYVAHLSESTVGAAVGGNYARWWTGSIYTSADQREPAGTLMQAEVNVAPGYYIQAVNVVGGGQVPFTLSGNGYNGGAGTGANPETIQFTMPAADTVVYIVYAPGPPVPSYMATLVVAGGDYTNHTATTRYELRHDVTGGDVITDVDAPPSLVLNAGDAIQGSFTPSSDYYITGITVTDDTGNAVPWTMNSDGTISVSMPAANITVTVTVAEIDGQSEINLTLVAAGTATNTSSITGTRMRATGTTSATATATLGGTATTATLSVYPGELVALSVTPAQLLSVTAGDPSTSSLTMSLVTGSGTVSITAPDTVTALWDDSLPTGPRLTFTMTDVDNPGNGTATHTAALNTGSGLALNLTSTTSAGDSDSDGPVADGDTVVVTWTLAPGYTARPLEITLADGTTIVPVYLSTTSATFTMPNPAQSVEVVLPVVWDTPTTYTANIVVRMEDGSALPAGADAYFNGHLYSIQAAAGTVVPYNAYAPNGYYISKVEVTPAYLGVGAAISGQFGLQTGSFVMPAASNILVNVYLKEGWPDEVKYDLRFHIVGNTGADQVTYDPPTGMVIVTGGTTVNFPVTGGTAVNFTATPDTATGRVADVKVLDAVGTELVSPVQINTSQPFTFTMPISDAHVYVVFRDAASANEPLIELTLESRNGGSGSADLTVGTTTSPPTPLVVDGVTAVTAYTAQSLTTSSDVKVTVTANVGSHLYQLLVDGVAVPLTPTDITTVTNLDGTTDYSYTLSGVSAATHIVAVLSPTEETAPEKFTAQIVVNDAGNPANSGTLSGGGMINVAYISNLNQNDPIAVSVAVAPGYRVSQVVVLPANDLFTGSGYAPNTASQLYSFDMPARDVVVYVEFEVDTSATYYVTLQTAWEGTTPDGLTVYRTDVDGDGSMQDYATVYTARTGTPAKAHHGQNAQAVAAAGEAVTVTPTIYGGTITGYTDPHYVSRYEVVDNAGNPVPYNLLTDAAGRVYLDFDMPASRVTVTVYYTDRLVTNTVRVHVSGIPTSATDYWAHVWQEPVTTSNEVYINVDDTQSITAIANQPVRVDIEPGAGGYIQSVYLMKGSQVLSYTYDPTANPDSFIMPTDDVDLYVVFSQTLPPSNYSAVLTVQGPAGTASGAAGSATLVNPTLSLSATAQSNDASVTVQANGGDVLEVTVVVNPGYAIDSITGSLTTVTATGNPNEYTFAMPANSNAGVLVVLKEEIVTNPKKVTLHVGHSTADFDQYNEATVSYTYNSTYHALTVAAGATGADSDVLPNVPPTQTVTLTVNPQPDYFVRAAYVVQQKEETVGGSTFPVYRLLDLSPSLEGTTGPASASATFTMEGEDVDVYVFYEKGTPPTDPWYNLVVFSTDYSLSGAQTNTGASHVIVNSNTTVMVSHPMPDTLISDGDQTHFYSIPAGTEVTLEPHAGTGYMVDQVVYTPPTLGSTTLTSSGQWVLEMVARNASAQVVFWEDSTAANSYPLTLVVDDQRTDASTDDNTAELAYGAAAPLSVTTTASGIQSDTTTTDVLTGTALTLTVDPGTDDAGLRYVAVASYVDTAGITQTIALAPQPDGTYTGSLTMPSQATTVTVTFFQGYPITLTVTHDSGVTPDLANTATLVGSMGSMGSLTGNYSNTPAVLGEQVGQTVSLTVFPTTDYQVKQVIATDSSGSVVAMTLPAGESWTDAVNGVTRTGTFIMPVGAVNIEVVFEDAVYTDNLRVTLTDATNTTNAQHELTVSFANSTPTATTLMAGTPHTMTTTAASNQVTDVFTGVILGDLVTAVVEPNRTGLPGTFVVKGEVTVGGTGATMILTPTVSATGEYTFTFAMPTQTASLNLYIVDGYEATLEVRNSYTPTAGSAGNTAVLANNSVTPANSVTVTSTTPYAFDVLGGLVSGEPMATTATPEPNGALRAVVLTDSMGSTYLTAAAYGFTMPPEDVTVTAFFDNAADQKIYIATVAKRYDTGVVADILNDATIRNDTHALAAGSIWAQGYESDRMQVSFTTAPGVYATVEAYEVDTSGNVTTTVVPVLQMGVTGSGIAVFDMPSPVKNVQVYVTYSNTPPVIPDLALTVTVSGGGGLAGNYVDVIAQDGTPAPFAVQDGYTIVDRTVTAGEIFDLDFYKATGYVLQSVTLVSGGVRYPLNVISMASQFTMPTTSTTLEVVYARGYTATLVLADGSAAPDDEARMSATESGATSATTVVATVTDPVKVIEPLDNGAAVTTTPDLKNSNSTLRGVMVTQDTTGSTTYLTDNGSGDYPTQINGDSITVTVVTDDDANAYLIAAQSQHASGVPVSTNNKITSLNNQTAALAGRVVQSGTYPTLWSELYAGDTTLLGLDVDTGYWAEVKAETQDGAWTLSPMAFRAGSYSYGITAPSALASNIQVTVTFYLGAGPVNATLVMDDATANVNNWAIMTSDSVPGTRSSVTVDDDVTDATRPTQDNLITNLGSTLTTQVTQADPATTSVTVLRTTATGGTAQVNPDASGNYLYHVPAANAEDVTITVVIRDLTSPNQYVAAVSKTYDPAVTDTVNNTVSGIANQTDPTQSGDGVTWVPVSAADMVEVEIQTTAGVYAVVTAVDDSGNALTVLQLGGYAYVQTPTPGSNVWIDVRFTTTPPAPVDLTVESVDHDGLAGNEVTATVTGSGTVTLTPAPADAGSVLTATLSGVTPGASTAANALTASGYAVDSVTLSTTGSGGSTISVTLTPDASGQYTFPVPTSNATLTVVYERVGYTATLIMDDQTAQMQNTPNTAVMTNITTGGTYTGTSVTVDSDGATTAIPVQDSMFADPGDRLSTAVTVPTTFTGAVTVLSTSTSGGTAVIAPQATGEYLYDISATAPEDVTVRVLVTDDPIYLATVSTTYTGVTDTVNNAVTATANTTNTSALGDGVTWTAIVQGDTVQVDFISALGVTATVTAVDDSGNALPVTMVTGNRATVTAPAYDTNIRITVEFTETQYRAHIIESHPPSASGVNNAVWPDSSKVIVAQTADSMTATVTVAPGYYIQAVTVVGTGSIPFTQSGNGYNGGAGGTETIQFTMPAEDAYVYIVYAQGVPPVDPSYLATLVVVGGDHTDPGTGADYRLTDMAGGVSITELDTPPYLSLNAGAVIQGSFTPSSGYYITGVTVTDSTGSPVPWTMGPSGTVATPAVNISVAMPASNITVTVNVASTAGQTPVDLTLVAAGTATNTSSITGTKADGTSATATLGGTNTATLSVYPGELVALSVTPAQLLSVTAANAGTSLSMNMATGAGTVSIAVADTVTATWNDTLSPTRLTFVMTDVDNDGTATNEAFLTLTPSTLPPPTLSLASVNNTGDSASTDIDANQHVYVTWRLDTGYTAQPLQVTLADGTTISPVYVSATEAYFTMPDPAQSVQVLLPVIKGDPIDYTANIVVRMEDGSTPPVDADAYFTLSGNTYSITTPAGTRVPYTAYAPNGYRITRVEVTPLSLGVSASITGAYGWQTGNFIMPAASNLLVNVYMEKAWPDEVEYDLRFHIVGNAGADRVTYDNTPTGAVTVPNGGATYSVTGGTNVQFTVTPDTGRMAVVTVLDDIGGTVLGTTSVPSGGPTFNFTMPLSDAIVNVFFRDDAQAGLPVIDLTLESRNGGSGSAVLDVAGVVTGPITPTGYTAQTLTTSGSTVEVTVTADVGSHLYRLLVDGSVVPTPAPTLNGDGSQTYVYTLTGVTTDTHIVAILSPDWDPPPTDGYLTAQIVVNDYTMGNAELEDASGRTGAYLDYLSSGDIITVYVQPAAGFEVVSVTLMPSTDLRLTTDYDTTTPNEEYRFPMPLRDVVVYVEFRQEPITATLEIYDNITGYTGTIPNHRAEMVRNTTVYTPDRVNVDTDSTNAIPHQATLDADPGDLLTTTVSLDTTTDPAITPVATVLSTTATGGTTILSPDASGNYLYNIPAANAEDVTIRVEVNDAAATDRFIAAVRNTYTDGTVTDTVNNRAYQINNDTTLMSATSWVYVSANDMVRVEIMTTTGVYATVTAAAADGTALAVLHMGGQAFVQIPTPGQDVQITVDFSTTVPVQDLLVTSTGHADQPGNEVRATATGSTPVTLTPPNLAAPLADLSKTVYTIASDTQVIVATDAATNYKVSGVELKVTHTVSGSVITMPLTLDASGDTSFLMPTLGLYMTAEVIVTYVLDTVPLRPYDPAHADTANPGPTADGYLEAVNRADHLIVTVPTVIDDNTRALSGVTITTEFTFYYSADGGANFTQLVVGTDMTVEPFDPADTTPYTYGNYEATGAYTGAKFILRVALDATTGAPTANGAVLQRIMDNEGTGDPPGYMLYVTANETAGTLGESAKTQLRVPRYYTLYGVLASYAPTHAATLTLTDEATGTVYDEVILQRTSGAGKWEQSFEFKSSELAGNTYTLNIDKAGHIDYERTGILLDAAAADAAGAYDSNDLIFSIDCGAAIELIAGDVNQDGYVNTTDRAFVNVQMRKLATDPTSRAYHADLDGDGRVTTVDLAIVNVNLHQLTEDYGAPVGLVFTPPSTFALLPEQCDCGAAEGETHAPDCPLYEQPVYDLTGDTEIIPVAPEQPEQPKDPVYDVTEDTVLIPAVPEQGGGEADPEDAGETGDAGEAEEPAAPEEPDTPTETEDTADPVYGLTGDAVLIPAIAGDAPTETG